MTWVDGVTIGETGPDGSVGRLSFRTPLVQMLLPVLIVPVVLLTLWLPGILASPADNVPTLFPGYLVGIVLAGLVGRLVNGRGVTLTPEALTVRRFGSRTIPWSQIHGLTIRNVMGSKQMVLHLAGGQRVKLVSPLGGFLGDPRFLDKFNTVGQWWMAYRGF